MTRLEFIAQIVPACKVAEAKHGIPWKWLVCQAIQSLAKRQDALEREL